MLRPGLIDGFLFERPCRIAAPKVQSLCGLRFRMTQLQQGFATDETGFRSHRRKGIIHVNVSACMKNLLTARLPPLLPALLFHSRHPVYHPD